MKQKCDPLSYYPVTDGSIIGIARLPSRYSSRSKRPKILREITRKINSSSLSTERLFIYMEYIFIRIKKLIKNRNDYRLVEFLISTSFSFLAINFFDLFRERNIPVIAGRNNWNKAATNAEDRCPGRDIRRPLSTGNNSIYRAFARITIVECHRYCQSVLFIGNGRIIGGNNTSSQLNATAECSGWSARAPLLRLSILPSPLILSPRSVSSRRDGSAKNFYFYAK